MNRPVSALISPAIISSILVLPLMALELVNRRNYHEGFPISLFGLLWFLPLAFILILRPISRNVRPGFRIMANPIILSLGLILLTLIAGLWFGVILDQMPCFLGVPICD
jgi:hypothetical protein